MAYVYAACTAHVTIFSTGGKFRPVSNFKEFHALTPTTRSCALLVVPVSELMILLAAGGWVVEQEMRRFSFRTPWESLLTTATPMQGSGWPCRYVDECCMVV